MPFLPLVLVLLIGSLAGLLGALLGIGGGVFLVPFFVLVLRLPIHVAVGVSLATVIANSSVAATQKVSSNLINMRLGMVLEIATAAGGLTGGVTAQYLSHAVLARLFAVITALTAVSMLARLNRRNVILDPRAAPGLLGGRFHEEESGGTVTYRVRRMPLAMVASFIAGNVSGLLGIGGGIVKVPVLNTFCGVPLRAAAATSAFMIGVTAVASEVIYYARGLMVPEIAAAAVVGVLVGSLGGDRISHRVRARWLKLLFAVLIFGLSILMAVRG